MIGPYLADCLELDALLGLWRDSTLLIVLAARGVPSFALLRPEFADESRSGLPLDWDVIHCWNLDGCWIHPLVIGEVLVVGPVPRVEFD